MTLTAYSNDGLKLFIRKGIDSKENARREVIFNNLARYVSYITLGKERYSIAQVYNFGKRKSFIEKDFYRLG